jgi:AraC family transcriptional regulator
MDSRVLHVLKKIEEKYTVLVNASSEVDANRFSISSIEPLDFERLARSVNLSKHRLCDLFRAELGKTPNQYEREMKLRLARELVATTYLRVNEILNHLNVGDHSHFHRQFKKYYGNSLSNIRKKARDINGAQNRQ